jgi:hypothetical protein
MVMDQFPIPIESKCLSSLSSFSRMIFASAVGYISYVTRNQSLSSVLASW